MKISIFFLILFCVVYLCRNVTSQTYNCLANATCGCSAQAAVLTKIVGGEVARSQTWGWAVSIRRRATNSHFCGGSIISTQHVLTAAHCVVGTTSALIRVYVGSVTLSNPNQARDVSAIRTHPGYNSDTFVNDIAILKVSPPFDLSQTGVDLVCLPDVPSTILAQGEYPAANKTVSFRTFFIYERNLMIILFFLACCNWLGCFISKFSNCIEYSTTSYYSSSFIQQFVLCFSNNF